MKITLRQSDQTLVSFWALMQLLISLCMYQWFPSYIRPSVGNGKTGLIRGVASSFRGILDTIIQNLFSEIMAS